MLPSLCRRAWPVFQFSCSIKPPIKLKIMYGLEIELRSMRAKDRRGRPCQQGKRGKKAAREEYVSQGTMIK